MFALHKWPARRPKCFRGGRPRTSLRPTAQKRQLDPLEELHKQGVLDDAEFSSGQLLQQKWQLYISAIGAPRVKTAIYDHTLLRGDGRPEQIIRRIEQDWHQISQILSTYDAHTRKEVDLVLQQGFPSTSPGILKAFLKSLNDKMRLTATS